MTMIYKLMCIMICFWFGNVQCVERKTINSFRALDSLSELSLLWHHPQALISDNTNINKSFESLVEHLQSRNLTTTNQIQNCSSHFQHLPDVFCKEVSMPKCLSVDEMLQLVPDSTKSVSEVLSRLCPLLLLQLHSSDCTSTPRTKESQLRPSSTAVWGYGVLFVTLISCCSLVGVVLLPLLTKNVYHVVLQLFEGLAVGSLAGSSLFHLIPQTFHLVGQDAEHGYLWKSLLIFCGIYLFYLSERLMKIVIDVREKKRKKHLGFTFETENSMEPLPDLSHLPKESVAEDGDKISLTNGTDVVPNKVLKIQNGFAYCNGTSNTLKDTTTALVKYKSDAELHSHHHDHNIHFEKGKSAIGTVAWMIIFGDGLHNFIDGLSIGAAFSESILAGISISVAVVCEEFPHELGDFAVLLSAGMTMRQALLYNFLSALTCYVGLVIGILLGDLADGSPYIFALAAGMFLYISLVDMMGELAEGIAAARKKGTAEQIKVLVIQNIGIILGVAILFVMARYAEHFNFDSFVTQEVSENTKDDHVQALYSGAQEAKQLHALLSR